MAAKIFDPCVYHQPDPDEELINEAGRLIHEANELISEDNIEGTQLEFDFESEEDKPESSEDMG